ncbi:MAG: ABC transporter ATP-binding protein [bacterium JZ-2024 1]
MVKETLPTLAGLLGKYRFFLMMGILCLLVVDGLQLLVPRVLKIAIDSLTQEPPVFPGHVVVYIVLLAAGIVLSRFGWRFFLFGTARKVERDIRDWLHRHFLHLPMEFFARKPVGDLMAHMSNDLMAVTEMVGMSLLALVDALVWSTATIGMMLWINVRLTLLLLIPFPFLGLFSGIFGREIHLRFRKVQAQFSRIAEEVEEMYRGIRVVQAYHQQEGAYRHLVKPVREYLELQLSLGKVSSVYQPGLTGFATLSTAILIGWGGRMVLAEQVSLGDFAALSAYLSMLIWPVMAFGWMVNIYQRGQASWKRIRSLMEEKPEWTTLEKKHFFISTRIPAINISHLSFSYSPGTPRVLRDVSLSVDPGEWVGITGRVGSGKSTLLSLLSGLYPPPPGKIYLMGQPIEEIPLNQVRQQVALVAQEPIIFTATVEENLKMGRAISDERMEEAARAAKIYEDICHLPEKFQTKVGERGFTLSGGQRQRIALARALLSSPDAWLFLLDDCLSQVDVETEQEILKNLFTCLKGKTVLFVAHRPSILSSLSSIIVLDEGTVVERGNHTELMQKGGFYARWMTLQHLPEVSCAPAF